MAPLSDSRPFAQAAAWYAAYRPPYAPAAIDHICVALRLGAASRVLDLGCGPGILTVPLALRVREVVALDVEPAMLEEGRRRATQAGVANVRWLEGRAEAIGEDLGRFDAAVLGQSFHWMDRDEVLRRLERLIVDGGGLALVAPSGSRRPVESWEPIAREVAQRYLESRGRRRLANPEPENTPALQRSRRFNRFDSAIFHTRLRRDPASILGCVYSWSQSPPDLFGDRRAAFESELTRELEAARLGGVFDEEIETEVVTALKQSP